MIGVLYNGSLDHDFKSVQNAAIETQYSLSPGEPVPNEDNKSQHQKTPGIPKIIIIALAVGLSIIFTSLLYFLIRRTLCKRDIGLMERLEHLQNAGNTQSTIPQAERPPAEEREGRTELPGTNIAAEMGLSLVQRSSVKYPA
jgi:hypothetical protein